MHTDMYSAHDKIYETPFLLLADSYVCISHLIRHNSFLKILCPKITLLVTPERKKKIVICTAYINSVWHLMKREIRYTYIPQHRFSLVSLCLKANAEMVPMIPSCHYMLLM